MYENVCKKLNYQVHHVLHELRKRSSETAERQARTIEYKEPHGRKSPWLLDLRNASLPRVFVARQSATVRSTRQLSTFRKKKLNISPQDGKDSNCKVIASEPEVDPPNNATRIFDALYVSISMTWEAGLILSYDETGLAIEY